MRRSKEVIHCAFVIGMIVVRVSLPPLSVEVSGIKPCASIDSPWRYHYCGICRDWLAIDRRVFHCDADSHGDRRQKPEDFPAYSVEIGHLLDDS